MHDMEMVAVILYSTTNSSEYNCGGVACNIIKEKMKIYCMPSFQEVVKFEPIISISLLCKKIILHWIRSEILVLLISQNK